MVTFSHVLCPTDLSEAALPPLTYAAALARWYEARLTVLHVLPPPAPLPASMAGFNVAFDVMPPPPRDVLREALQAAAARAGAETPHLALEIVDGDPATAIVDQAVAQRADIVVLGTHGRSGFERFMIGSIAEKVLRKAPCPVLTVPPHMPAASASDVHVRHVLCAVDFSEASLQAFGFALALARQARASLTAVHAIEWLVEDEPPTHVRFNVPEYRAHRIDEARQRLQALIDSEVKGAVPATALVPVGRAHREILEAADDAGADLIVMGMQGRGGLGAALFGSTTQQVVRGATCPVLTTRAPADVRPA